MSALVWLLQALLSVLLEPEHLRVVCVATIRHGDLFLNGCHWAR